MKKNVLSILTLTLLFLVSCTTTTEDPSSATTTFSIQQKKAVKKSTLGNKSTPNGINGDTYTFSIALLGVSKIEIDKKYETHDSEKDEDIEYKGNYVFNVLTGTSSPELPSVDMEPGTYHELEFYVDTVMSSGNSIEINGTVDDGVAVYTFEFSSTMDEEFEIENENGIDLTENDLASFILYLRLEDLFTGVDFSTADVDNDGIIRINADSNQQMASEIEDNFEDIMDFEEESEHHDDGKDDD